MKASNQRIWGFESNFGGLADLTIVKANQLMPKPTHLSWEEAAVNALCAATSYRMLVGDNAARMKQGDSVLVWGATGGLGGYACQLVLNGGGVPVGIVSSPDKAELLGQLGVEHVIDRSAEAYRFWSDEHTQDEGEWRRFGKKVRSLIGDDPRHRVRASRPVHHGSIGVRRQAGRHRRDVCRHQRLHDRVRQPASVDEAEADRVEPLRQLRRGVGDEPPHRSGAHPADPVEDVHARRHGLGRLAGPITTCTRASSACCAWPQNRGRASPIRKSANGSAMTASRCSPVMLPRWKLLAPEAADTEPPTTSR